VSQALSYHSIPCNGKAPLQIHSVAIPYGKQDKEQESSSKMTFNPNGYLLVVLLFKKEK